MMHNLICRSRAALVIVGGLFVLSGESLAATATQAEPAPVVEEDVCIPKYVEEKVKACPEGAGEWV